MGVMLILKETAALASVSFGFVLVRVQRDPVSVSSFPLITAAAATSVRH